MKRLVLATFVPVSMAFGAGMALDSTLTSISNPSPQSTASSFSPEAIQRSIDARTLPETWVRDFN
jgi:hypothetical protein